MLSALLFALSGVVFLSLKIGSGDIFPPPLDPEEEKTLFVLCKKGDQKAREKLISHNLRLVSHIIKKYYGNCKDQEDLVSIGTIGLIKAIDSYDDKKGSRFATYAGKCLQNEILMYFRSQKKLALQTSINDPIEFDKDGNPLTYDDIMSVEDDIVEKVYNKSMSAYAYQGILKCLDDREREIIFYRYGLNRGKAMTQREVAKLLDISRSYVSRLEKSALEKLRDFLSMPRNFI